MNREELKNGYYWVMPQRGYYKDKWVIATYENGMFWIHGTGEAFMPDSLTINYNKIPMTDPLPPAEGAEDIRQLLLGWEHYKRDHFRESEALDVEAILMSEYSQIAAQQQPTAEGAEEILEKYGFKIICHKEAADAINDTFVQPIVAAMHEFASLHAQRIADKMVEENLVEFGNMIRDEPNGDIAALAEYFIRTINLKTREK